MKHASGTFGVFMLISSCALTQLQPSDLDDLMMAELKASESKPAKLKLAFEAYSEGAGCDSMHLATLLWLVLAQNDATWTHPLPLVDSLCPVQNNVLHYEFATYAFRNGDMDAMKASALQALSTADSPKQTYLALNALGAYYQNTGQLDSAYASFENAYLQGKDFLVDHPDPVGINNLANASIMTRQWSNALKWAKLAESKYFEALKNGDTTPTPDSDFLDQILSNRLFAEMNLLDSAAAAKTYDRMRLDLHEDYNSIMMAATAASYLLWSNRREEFQNNQPVFEASFSADSSLSTEILGIHSMLFEPWKTTWSNSAGMPEDLIWDYVRSCPVVYRDAALPRESTSSNRGKVEAARPWWPTVLPFIALGLWGCAVIAMIFRWRKLSLIESVPTDELIDTINGAFMEGSRDGAVQAFLALKARFPGYQAKATPSLPSLTSGELDILNDWVSGVRPKQTADRLGVAAATVYNSRSRIRGKLNVPKNEDVPTWYLKTMNPKP
ncbi:MAG: LuxR C-terminal-related transcriptional regulator [Flavobacteriales bacterium]